MLSEIMVSDGEGEPYIVVPEQFKFAFFEWLKEKIPSTFPRSGQTNAVMELVDTSVKEAEKYIEEWFGILSVHTEKHSFGHEDNPTSVSWRIDTDAYRQA